MDVGLVVDVCVNVELLCEESTISVEVVVNEGIVQPIKMKKSVIKRRKVCNFLCIMPPRSIATALQL
jgi:hypothetical protein